MKLPPIDAHITQRPKPKLPDKAFYSLWEIIYHYSDLACWKADKAEALSSGIKEEVKNWRDAMGDRCAKSWRIEA
jgi:hypothetical protein